VGAFRDDYAISQTVKLSAQSLLLKFKKPYKIQRLKGRLQPLGVAVWTTSRETNFERLLVRLGMSGATGNTATQSALLLPPQLFTTAARCVRPSSPPPPPERSQSREEKEEKKEEKKEKMLQEVW
jgi:hypothetical protein